MEHAPWVFLVVLYDFFTIFIYTSILCFADSSHQDERWNLKKIDPNISKNLKKTTKIMTALRIRLKVSHMGPLKFHPCTSNNKFQIHSSQQISIHMNEHH